MRQFICIFSAFMLLVGCVKNEPLTPGSQGAKAEIAFESPIIAPKTKSVQEISSYPASLDMKVWGFFSDSEYPAVDAVNKTVGSHRYMEGATFTNIGTVWGCNERGYYWQKSGYLHFVAHAPAESENLTSSNVTDEGLQLTGYTVPDNADEDLLVSQVAYSQAKPANPEEGAPLIFDHVLSSLIFRIKSGIFGDRSTNDPERLDTDLRIVKIEILEARATGDFSQQMTSWNNEQMAAASTEKGWIVADDAATKDFVVYDGTATRGLLLTDQYTDLHDIAQAASGYSLTNLILLPQVIKDNVILKVTFDMTHSELAEINGVDVLWLQDQVVKVPLNQCGIDEWLRGHRYVYNLTLSRGKIECSIDTLPWDESEIIESVDGNINHDFNVRD